MKVLRATVRHTWTWSLRLGCMAGVLVVLGLVALRLLLPRLDAYRAQVEQTLGAYLQVPVSIQRVTTTWYGWEPGLRLEGFSLLDPAQHTALASFDQAAVRLNLLRSLARGGPVLRNVRLQGSRLLLRANHGGVLDLALQTPAGAPVALKDLLVWLNHVESLDLVFSEVHWPVAEGADETAAGISPLVFRDLRLSLRQHHDKRRVGFMVTLPEAIGGHVHAAAEMRAEGDDPAAWQGTFYVRADDLTLNRLPLPESAKLAAAGRARTLEAWGDWREQRLVNLVGRGAFSDLVLPAPANAASGAGRAEYAALNGDFAWRHDAGGWRWRSDWRLSDKTGAVVATPFLDAHGGEPDSVGLEVRAGDLRLRDILALASPWLDAERRRWLEALSPQAQITELAFRLAPPVEGEIDYALAARVRDFGVRPWGRLPGARRLDGEISLTPREGQARLDSRNVVIDTKLPRAQPTLDALRGLITWRLRADGWDIHADDLELANTALKARLDGDLALFDDRRGPLTNLRLRYSLTDLGKVRDYLPVPLLHPDLVRWLDQALVRGKVTQGEGVLRGPLADFPFDKGQGLFEMRFRAENAILDYDAGWPRIEGYEADVVFRNRSLRIEAVSGKILAAEVERLNARIDDLDQPVVDIDGQARGSGSTLLRVVRESPLARRLGPYVANLQASGENILQLALRIPLDPRPMETKGTVIFTGGNLGVPGLELSRVRGNLEFTDDTLTATDVRLLVRGEPARLDVTTERQGNRGSVNFRLRAPLSLAALTGPHAAALAPYLDGRARWDITARVRDTPPGAPPDWDFTMDSDLEGVTVKLPPPLGKAAGEKRPFQLRTRLAGNADSAQVTLDYEPNVRTLLELAGFPSELRLNRGELRINAGAARLPAAPGMAIVAELGRFEPRLDGQLPPWVRSIDARARELILGGFAFPRVRFEAQRQRQTLAISLSGEALQGSFSVPLETANALPLRVNLQTLAARRSTGPEANDTAWNLDPRTLPPMQITVEDLRLDGNKLGRLRLVTTPQANGLRLDDLSLNSPLHEFNASGEWLVTPQGQRSRLQAGFSSDDLGKSLLSLGYAPGLEGGKASADLTMSWPGPLFKWDTARLQGQLDLTVGPGRLLNVEPGVGRIVGLLNPFNLLRRLRLDFTDLFAQGMSFDRIKSDFSFANGQARTDELLMEGPSASIQIKGRVGLRDRDYDQTITVTPKVGNPLTIAGAIAGGPPVGAAAFLVEQLIKPGVERATRYHYMLTGPWENPVIQPAERAEVTAQQPSQGDR